MSAHSETKLFNNPVMNNALILSLILSVAALCRISYFIHIIDKIWFKFYYNDALNFHEWGSRISQGQIIGEGVFVQSPFYAYLLGLIYSLTNPENVIIVPLIQFLLGMLNCCLIYYLSKKYFSKLVSSLASIGYATYGMAIFYEGTLLTVTIIVSLNLLFLLSVTYAIRYNSVRAWLTSGIILGLSAITRPSILPMVMIIIMGILYFSKGFSNTQIKKSILTFLSGIILVFSPLIIRNALVLGEPILSVGTGGINFYIGNSVHSPGYLWHRGQIGLNAKTIVEDYRNIAQEQVGYDLSYSEVSRFWYSEAIKEIWQKPGHWLKIIFNKILLFFNHEEITTNIDYSLLKSTTPVLQLPWLSFGIICPLGIFGIIIVRNRWRELFLLYGIGLVYLFINVFIWVSSEYRFPIVPVLLIFSAVTLEACFKQLQTHQWKSLFLYLSGILLLFAITHINLIPRDTLVRWKAYAHYNIACLYIRDQQWEKASEEFKIAYHQFPGNEILGIGYAEALVKTNKIKESMLVSMELYNKFPDSPAIIREYAKMLTKNEEHEKAIYLRTRLVELDPVNELYFFELGVTYLWAKRDREANNAFQKALEINPVIQSEIERTKYRIQEDRLLKITPGN